MQLRHLPDDVMDVFALRESLVGEYSGFARSFTDIRAGDIRDAIAAQYDSGRFSPEPLVQINPVSDLGAP